MENIIFTNDDVQRGFLGPLHGTTPALVKANVKTEILLRAVNMSVV